MCRRPHLSCDVPISATHLHNPLLVYQLRNVGRISFLVDGDIPKRSLLQLLTVLDVGLTSLIETSASSFRQKLAECNCWLNRFFLSWSEATQLITGWGHRHVHFGVRVELAPCPRQKDKTKSPVASRLSHCPQRKGAALISVPLALSPQCINRESNNCQQWLQHAIFSLKQLTTDQIDFFTYAHRANHPTSFKWTKIQACKLNLLKANVLQC